MKIDGAYHCGSIAYEAHIDPERIRICHCNDCQVLSGTAFRATVPVREADFHLLRGELSEYIKIAESGRSRVQTFCGKCGSPIYATSTGGENRQFGIRLGTVTQRRELTPTREFWRRSALSWVSELSCAEVFETQRRGCFISLQNLLTQPPCPCSSAVEQRFCKPKVGSSILSGGTIFRLNAFAQANAAPLGNHVHLAPFSSCRVRRAGQDWRHGHGMS